MMTKPFPPSDEEKRLSILNEYKLLDTATEEVFDSITWVASKICNTPISLITHLTRSPLTNAVN